jgi:hypothetical protein
MPPVKVPRTVLFIIFCLWTTGSAAALSIGLCGGPRAQLSVADGYSSKAQFGGEAGVLITTPVAGWLSLGASAGVAGASASDMLGGFGYRSYVGGFLGFVAEAGTPLSSRKYSGELRGGGRLGLAANVAVYGNTSLAFFFPSLGLDAFLAWRPAAFSYLDIGITVPLRLDLRRDMQFSGSAGLGLTISVARKAAP